MKESDSFLLLIYRRSFDKLETWLYFLPVCDVVKLCVDGFLNDEVLNLNALKSASLLCAFFLCLLYVAPNSASSCAGTVIFDWAPAI